MNSYPRIESLPELPEAAMEEGITFHIADYEDECQQVDSLRVARLSRAQARWEGALSETPRRGRQLIDNRVGL
jgi:hypothetical protein